MYVIEIGFELETGEELIELEKIFQKMGLAYYIEPPSNYYSLVELEADCEGK